MNETRIPIVDLVVPVYNEAHVLEQSIGTLHSEMSRHEFCWRIVVVNNGSTDDTRAVGERIAQDLDRYQFLHLEEKGRGRALARTWSETDAEFSIYMDVDLSTDLEAVPRVIELFGEADIVVGSRLHPEARIVRSRKRDVISRCYNRLIRWTLRTRSFDDAQCGFKGVRVAAIRPLLPLIKNKNWFFDTELLVLAELASLRIRVLPVAWIEDADTRVNILKTTIEDLKGLARLRWTARSLIRDAHRSPEKES